MVAEKIITRDNFYNESCRQSPVAKLHTPEPYRMNLVILVEKLLSFTSRLFEDKISSNLDNRWVR